MGAFLPKGMTQRDEVLVRATETFSAFISYAAPMSMCCNCSLHETGSTFSQLQYSHHFGVLRQGELDLWM